MENARTENCRISWVDYTTWYIDSDGVFTLVGHTTWTIHCPISLFGSGGGGGGGGGSNGGGGGGGGGGGSNGGGGDWSGGIGGGGLSGPYYGSLYQKGAGRLYRPGLLTNFNIENAIAADGPDRRRMNESLKKALLATELAAGISTWTYAKAEALARAGGFSLKEVFPLFYSGIRRVGIASAIFNTWKAAIILIENGDELTTEEMVVLAGGVVVGIGAAVTTGWIAVGFGTVSLGILIYDEIN